MDILRNIIIIALIIACAALTIIILLQEGKSQGLGALSGSSDSYWGKNKGRSMEGHLVKITTGLVIFFMAAAAVLSMGFIQ